MTAEPSFEWDEANIRHLALHNVTAMEFEQVMRNDPILFDYENVDGADRWSGLVLVVAFTIREGRMRAATAFDASSRRARQYWRQKGQ